MNDTNTNTIEFNPDTFLKTEYVLPPLPAIVITIKDMIEEDRADMAEISELVAADPALVIQVLKIVNSAYYSMPRPITDLKYAIAFLGLAEIYRIVLTLAVVSTLEIDEENLLKQFWRDSYLTALTSKFLTRRFEPGLAVEELWSSTLLHDIGRLLSAKFFPDEFRAVNNYCEEHGCLVEEAEKALGVPSRATLGALLARHWELPEMIRVACAAHDEVSLFALDPNSRDDAFQRMICLSYLTARLGEGKLCAEKSADLANRISQFINLDREHYSGVVESVNELEEEVESFVARLS